jgi:FHS family Na+ dependent glucose MFS transporter 1
MISQSAQKKKNWLQTAVYFAALAGFGVVVAAWGPVLPRLAEQTQTDLGKIGVIFTIRALGVFLGSSVGGRIYDRLPGHPVMAVSLLLMAATFATSPMVSSLWLMLLIVFVMGIAAGVLVVGTNTLLVWVHPDNVGPWMNGLNFFAGAGGFISPIVIAAFLTANGEIYGAFWALAVLVAVVAAGALFVPSPAIRKTNDSTNADGRVRLGLVLPFALVFLLYVGAEVSFSGWVYTFTVALHPGATTSAGLLTSAFWAAMAIGRLAAIPISSRLRPRTILLVDFLGALASLVLIVSLAGSLTALWIGTISFGLFMASLFPTWMTFTDRRVKVNGKITGILFSATALGGMTFPWLCGQLFETFGPRTIILVIFVTLLVAFLIYSWMRSVRPRQAETAATE